MVVALASPGARRRWTAAALLALGAGGAACEAVLGLDGLHPPSAADAGVDSASSPVDVRPADAGVDADCASCVLGPPSCSPSCAEGTACSAATDCISGECTGGQCAPPACSPNCHAGSPCGASGECVSGICTDAGCRGQYTFGGTLAGLTPGESIVLKDQSGNTVSLSANGPFTMSVPIDTGATYGVTIDTAPSSPIAQTCTVANGSGAMGTADVSDIAVNCDLLAYFPFDGNADDESGYGHGGVVGSPTLTTGVGGKANSAYLFHPVDGGNGDITAAMQSGFLPNGSASRTLTAWIKPTVSESMWGILSYGTGSNVRATEFGIGVQQGGVAFWAAGDDYVSPLSMPIGAWTFVAAVYSSVAPTSITLYVNGQDGGAPGNGTLNASTTTPAVPLNTPPASNLVIGYDRANKVYFTGAIGSIRIYGHALSASEVQAVYSASP